MNLTYKASKDNLVKVVSTLVVVLFVFLAQQSVRDLIAAVDLTERLINAGVLLLLIGTILVCYVFSPSNYQLSEHGFTINKMVRSRVIAYNTIADAKLITKVDLKGTYRTFGVGGLFGYYGKFRNHKLGPMTWYATQNRNYILLILKAGEKILITPDDLELVNALKGKLV